VDNENLVSLFHKIGELKTIKRSGWVRCGVPEPESVADHTFRCAFMAMILGDMMDVDSEKIIKMTLIHDVAEAVAGDITPHDGISRKEKSQREEDGLQLLLEGIRNSEQYIALWKEYEEGNTPESKLARNIDKLEMALQAREYQTAHPEKNLSEFIDGAEKFMEIPEVMAIFEFLRNENNQYG
jgi:5'-deoxynucleotidase YfbR-like HD superfamily hydrolase